MSRCKSWGDSSVFEWLCCVCHKHALALAHASRGGKCKKRGFPPLERSDQWSGGGVAQRRSAQAKRGRLGCLLSRARDGVPQQAWFPCISVKRRDCFFWVPASRGGRCPPEKARRDVWCKTARPAPTLFSSYDQQTGSNCPSCQSCWVCPELRCSVIVPVDVTPHRFILIRSGMRIPSASVYQPPPATDA